MSGVDGNLKLNTQLAPAPAAQPPMPSPANTVPIKSVPEPVPVPTVSAQELGREAQALKGESLKQLSKNQEELQAAVRTLNVAMRKAPTSLHFSVDSASHRFVVNVTDNDTGELLRSLPGDAILKFAEHLESLKGVLFDESF
ncbi:flagellar protein FlaG [Porticoccaceae bacterium]|nr:flagellar protein FlaG [Porticoccaceae bacterium]MDC1452779.1 flagellar protein FlaG [Porticoccaceae bacterium]